MTEARSGSLRTGLQVLDVLCAHPAGLGVTELAARLGKDKGNLHRLLRILEEEGHVQQDLPTKRYRPTVKIVNLASSLLRNLDLLEIARPVMRALKQSTKETVHLAHRTAQGGVYIAQERATGRLTVETDIGATVPIHCTSTGKALFSDATREELQQILVDPLESFTVRTHRTLAALMIDIEQVRERGYSYDDEEHYPGIRCVAAPIRDMYGKVIGSIGVSGPEGRMTLARLPEVGAEVKDSADQISLALGGADLRSAVSIDASSVPSDAPDS